MSTVGSNVSIAVGAIDAFTWFAANTSEPRPSGLVFEEKLELDNESPSIGSYWVVDVVEVDRPSGK